jgi:hypothetical protein
LKLIRERVKAEFDDLRDSFDAKMSEARTYNAILNRVEMGWPGEGMSEAAERINEVLPVREIFNGVVRSSTPEDD